MRIVSTFGGFAVGDIEAAGRFYADVLGVDVQSEADPAGNGEVLWLRGPGDEPVMVYPKADHTPAEFTVYNLEVDDVEAAQAELSGRGATFERYDAMGADERGIVRLGGVAAAWLKDPSGNIVGILQRTT